jgi:hypothetical protein
MSEDIWDEIEADASAFDKLTTKSGGELSELIRHVSAVKFDLAELEGRVKQLKERRDHCLFTLIPEKMQETGLDKVVVGDNTVSLSVFVSGTMPKDPIQRDIAMTHLRDIGASDFIKNEVSVSFGVKEDNRAKAMQADLEANGFEPVSKTWVEPMTLKKLIRERVEANQEIDLELFNASMRTFAKITGKGEGT